MKRRLFLFMALCLLLVSCLAVLPTGAEEGNWKTLNYTPLTVAEGETPIATALTEGENALTESCVIVFDAEQSVVLMNDKEIESGKTLELTGIYVFSVYKKADYIPGGVNDQVVTYTVQMLPNLKILSGEQEMPYTDDVTFTFFPTIVCDNAYQIEILNDAAITPIKTTTAYTLEEFGSFTLTVYGMSRNNASTAVQTLHFSVKPCHVITGYVEALDQCAMGVEVGAFGDKNYTVLLDGTTELAPGFHQVTKVGAHTLELYSNGTKVSDSDPAVLHMPSAEESKLRIQVELPALEFDTPEYSINFDLWDAGVTLDGKPVSGIVALEKHGTHRLEVVDENGHVIPDCFMIRVGDAEPVAADAVEYTFNNPHYIYVIIVGVPAALLLIAAVFFLIKRRTIV